MDHRRAQTAVTALAMPGPIVRSPLKCSNCTSQTKYSPPAHYGIAFGQYIEVNKRLQSRLWIGMPRRGWVCGEPHGANLAFMAL